jgi:hypothetical protein
MPDAKVINFLESSAIAVVGANRDSDKYGYRVWRSLRERGKLVFAVNPNCDEIEGEPCYDTLSDLSEPPPAVIFITPPDVTQTVVEEALKLGVRRFWMQPGAESFAALAAIESAGGEATYNRCILVTYL